MATATKRTSKRTTKKQPKDGYQAITDRIIAQLENGTVPWSKPWVSAGGMWPTSLSSGKPYRGINILTLSITAMLAGYESPYWGTYNQIKERGGQVRKGEHGTEVVLWRPVEKKDQAGDVIDRFMVIRVFVVFNSEQADWPDDSRKPKDVERETHDWSPVEACEQIANNMPTRPTVKHGGDRAYYSPTLDYVQMPKRDSFPMAEGYYATLFHELAHSTGHESRLNRDTITLVDRFGSERYSKEELVAEMTAAFLCAEAGVENMDGRIEASAAYIESWLKALKNDKKLVVQAAAGAQKAADYILDRTARENGDDEA